jgi:hypothetical protein
MKHIYELDSSQGCSMHTNSVAGPSKSKPEMNALANPAHKPLQPANVKPDLAAIILELKKEKLKHLSLAVVHDPEAEH